MVRFAGLVSSIFILSFVVRCTAGRPITGSASGASTMITGHVTVEHPQVHGSIPESTLPDQENYDHEPPPVTNEPTTVSREEGDVTHEKRMLAVSSEDDYEDPSGNENPRHKP